jgi:5-formyltetrahydrofolate cyclo-ligase
MIKKGARKKYKEARKKLSLEEIEEKSLTIANQLVKMDIWDKTYYHLFLPIEEQKEVNSEYLLNILQAKDKEIIISKSDFANGEFSYKSLPIPVNCAP